MLNLDTHILVFALQGSLTSAEHVQLSGNAWGISAIVLWELAILVSHDRIDMDLDSVEYRRLFARIHVWPLDTAVCRQSVALDFKSDPADELIAATSIIHRAPLVTRDRKLRKSAMVPIARAIG
jgi:PIN domain nuclease of toxin-antitoxin system